MNCRAWPSILALFVFSAVWQPVAAESTVAGATPDFAASCADHFSASEFREGIPGGLLQSISTVESGGSPYAPPGASWPWTIDVGGQGRFFATKAEAVAEVRRLQAAGIRSIDVGCMQVNLMHHPTAFRSLDEAFDPAHNVGYAARFLRDLQATSGSWDEAVARYHSGDPLKGAQYRRRVLGGGQTPQPHATPHSSVVRTASYSVEEVSTRGGVIRIFRFTPH